ncbi:peptide chain release factor N(5)-glutamine methyltransferase [Aliigemmobacter aestuarii]|uniref:Release factor glutamine methyltransferase n=1 Tax=Aliigemmobacter aestuarii TaxID=1445661 RepID=A0A4S3ML75_9RHOB|nr:peptide chain release factor N(5)-glutamine methyltransferase [Gemmobacter aestuarii]THD82958.1 peptide chain release factor N(5)-glutamine methyltransferase [Gemmobacter aestuarii]
MRADEALRAAAARLSAAGIEGAARDARLLLAGAMGIAPDRLILAMAEDVAPEALSRLDAFLAARERRQPVSQILGMRLFWGRAFRVTPDVLDPRPETETLISEALSEPFSRVLDLGTGSGCILLTLLSERPQATGLGVDLSPAALAVAGANRTTLGLEARAVLLQGDWFAPVSGRFDLIVSNPPYIAVDEMPALAPEVRDWEPQMALTPGGDGLDAYRAIARGAPLHLAPGGRIIVEIGPAQGAAVSALFGEAGLRDVRIGRDMDGRDRIVTSRAA